MYKYKFPPKMFQNIELIDFGAGTGLRAINFANWGTKCTLVELSDRSSEISKKLLKIMLQILMIINFLIPPF